MSECYAVLDRTGYRITCFRRTCRGIIAEVEQIDDASDDVTTPIHTLGRFLRFPLGWAPRQRRTGDPAGVEVWARTRRARAVARDPRRRGWRPERRPFDDQRIGPDGKRLFALGRFPERLPVLAVCPQEGCGFVQWLDPARLNVEPGAPRRERPMPHYRAGGRKTWGQQRAERATDMAGLRPATELARQATTDYFDKVVEAVASGSVSPETLLQNRAISRRWLPMLRAIAPPRRPDVT